MPLLLHVYTPTAEAFRSAWIAASPPPTVSAWLTARYVFDEMPVRLAEANLGSAPLPSCMRASIAYELQLHMRVDYGGMNCVCFHTVVLIGSNSLLKFVARLTCTGIQVRQLNQSRLV